MLKVLKQDWLAVKEGDIYPTQFEKGAVLSGDLLVRANALGLIEEVPAVSDTKASAAPENKGAPRK